MTNDSRSGTPGDASLIGTALTGRFLLDNPATDNASGQPAGGAAPPRPLNRLPPRAPLRISSMPDRSRVSRGLPGAGVGRSSVVIHETQAQSGADPDGDEDDGLVRLAGCPKGWLISEEELARRFAKLGAKFEDVEVDTEADRPQPSLAPARAGSYTSLFDMPRRAVARR